MDTTENILKDLNGLYKLIAGSIGSICYYDILRA